MTRNFTVLAVVVALLTLVATPAAFAGQDLSMDTAVTAQAAPAKAIADTDSGLIDQLLGFFVGIFKSAWAGEAAGATGGRTTPTERGPGFDPDLA
ncbi:MAG: hypothetical protein KDD47_24615 [Acidobacteria bacterium]|nr:hypothetical protein [Acidobacteriota bacterium]